MKGNRRQFLKYAGLSGMATSLPFAAAFSSGRVEAAVEGFVIDVEEQEQYYIAGRQAPVRIIVDKSNRGLDNISLCMEEIVPGDGIPVHKHLNEDEVVYIQKGSGIFTLGDKEYSVKEGSVAFVPKGGWHGLRNTGTEDLHMLFSFSPAGFEGYFREIGVPKCVAWKDKTAEEFAAINQKYGIVYKR